jgi:type IV pilus assembly protein PilB
MALGHEELKSIFVTRTGILTDLEFEDIKKAAHGANRPFEQLLMERGFVSSRYFLELIGEYYGKPIAELKLSSINPDALSLIPEHFATTNLVIPFAKSNSVLKVAMVDPNNEEVIRAMRRVADCDLEIFVATEHAVKKALILYHGGIRGILHERIEGLTRRAGEKPEEAPSAVSLIDAIIDAAVLTETSDIHIEPFENQTIVRFRIDGQLRSMTSIPKVFHLPIIARLKIMSSLRVDDRRHPQDGRMTLQIKGEQVDVRISLVPSMWGEKVVMRVLPKGSLLFDLRSLGFLDYDLNIIQHHLRRTYGMILVCGPTGSGKTSTLYSFLQEIGLERVDSVNISTIEDPIEYTVERVTQIQTQPDIKLTFAEGLRALLRQDPDIIMVGEIRDVETADMAVRASLVGRLVVSSLHTNDALGAVPRLLDMGVESYLVSSTLSLVVAQRLARKLCMHCRESYAPDEATIDRLRKFYDYDYALFVLAKIGVLSNDLDPMRGVRFYRAKGCAQCDHIGYRGRIGIFELLEVSPALRDQVMTHRDSVAMQRIVRSEGMKTLQIDGLAKVILGLSDLDEVMRITS